MKYRWIKLNIYSLLLTILSIIISYYIYPFRNIIFLHIYILFFRKTEDWK